MSPTNAKEADDICELLGPYVAAAMYSKTWQLREAALQQLEAFVGNKVDFLSAFVDVAALVEDNMGRYRALRSGKTLAHSERRGPKAFQKARVRQWRWQTDCLL